MKIRFLKSFFLLSIFVIRTPGEELWRSYGFEVTLIENNVSQVNEYADSSMYLLINEDSIHNYEEQGGCFLKGADAVDSIRNDSVYSSGFLSTRQSGFITEKDALYYSGNEMIYYQSENIIDEGMHDTSKIYFYKIDTSYKVQLNANVCTASIILSRKSIRNNRLQLIKSNNVYNLLGRKLNKNSIVRSNKLNKLIYR